MIAVENVIRKLVGDYEFVIIPGFGALLSHQVPAIYDNSSETFSPPVKKLAFNEYLKLDDGLLANFISRQEKISHTDAVEYVRKYTDNLRSALEVSGNASIVGIGEFSKNIEGKLVFEPKTEKYFKDDWYGFEKIKARKLDAKVVSIPAIEAIDKGETVEVFEFEEERGIAFKWTSWTSAAAIAGLLCGLSLFLFNSHNSYIKSTLNPFTELFNSSAGENEMKVEVPAIPEKEVEVKEEVVVDSMKDTVDAMVTPPAVADSEKASEVIEEVKQTPVVSDAKFYLVAGAFRGTKQANVLLNQLKEKGYDEALILPGDRYSSKVKVAVKGFDNERDAYVASSQLKSVIGEQGWVFKKK
ncbi:HU domain-containing protein [Dyadobacter bucti]|uniref:HU domain-containing protein n=1 Tax=Dyadobacter bucti TaxID=2572203 RepID=UPI001108803F|nr:SPOR domain-containing protein [Dyadobacter bucti]